MNLTSAKTCAARPAGPCRLRRSRCPGLRRRGWDVYPVNSGPEARRLARMVQADLVVLDTFLPTRAAG